MGGTKKPAKATKKTKARVSAPPKRRSRELREDELEKVAGGATVAVKWSPTAVAPTDSSLPQLDVESISLGTPVLEKVLIAPLYKPRKF